MSLLYTLFSLLPTGYILTSLLLLVGSVRPAYRALARHLLSTSNLVVLVVAVGVVLFTSSSLFAALTSGTATDNYLLLNRIAGPYWFFYWGSFLCRGILPQLFWFRRFRRSPLATTLVALGLLADFYSYLFSNPGRADYLPSSWAMPPNYLVLLISALLYLALLAAIAALRRWCIPAPVSR